MIFKIVILIVISLAYITYSIYFKRYVKVRKVFLTLSHFLDARDTQLLKILPEIKNEELKKEVVNAVGKRRDCFKSNQNEAILADAKLNSYVKSVYAELSNKKRDDVTNNIFASVMKFEKELKNIRNTYNIAVEEYNKSLIKHRTVCFRLIRMKVLDTYAMKD